MLNLHRESQGRIHSFRLSRQNIKHGPFTSSWRILFDYQCKRVRNGHMKINTIFEKNRSCDTDYGHTSP